MIINHSVLMTATHHTCPQQKPLTHVAFLLSELLLRVPWLPGDNDIDQLGRIFQALGTPTQDNWPGHDQLPGYVEFNKVSPPPLRTLFPKVCMLCCIIYVPRHALVCLVEV